MTSSAAVRFVVMDFRPTRDVTGMCLSFLSIHSALSLLLLTFFKLLSVFLLLLLLFFYLFPVDLDGSG